MIPALVAWAGAFGLARTALTTREWTRAAVGACMGMALRQIQHGAPVSEAVLDHGYESESGFREAFTLVFGNPPSAVDRESCIWINRIATPLGSMIMGRSYYWPVRHHHITTSGKAVKLFRDEPGGTAT